MKPDPLIPVAKISVNGDGRCRWQNKKIVRNLQKRVDDPNSEAHKAFTRLLLSGYEMAMRGELPEVGGA